MADIVYLVRHAAPPLERRGRFWGHADPGLDAASLAAASRLKKLIWHPPDRVLSSPLERADRTAGRIAESLCLPVEHCAAIAEADFGLFDGLTYREISERYPDFARRWEREGDAFFFPAGESVSGFLERACRAWRNCLALPELAVLAVSHAGVISVWACLFFGLPLARRFVFRQDYGAISAFVRKKDGTGWAIRYFNDRT